MENSDERVYFLHLKGNLNLREPLTNSGLHWYLVQTGAFTNSNQKELHLVTVRNTGVNAYIIQ